MIGKMSRAAYGQYGSDIFSAFRTKRMTLNSVLFRRSTSLFSSGLCGTVFAVTASVCRATAFTAAEIYYFDCRCTEILLVCQMFAGCTAENW